MEPRASGASSVTVTSQYGQNLMYKLYIVSIHGVMEYGVRIHVPTAEST